MERVFVRTRFIFTDWGYLWRRQEMNIPDGFSRKSLTFLAAVFPLYCTNSACGCGSDKLKNKLRCLISAIDVRLIVALID